MEHSESEACIAYLETKGFKKLFEYRKEYVKYESESGEWFKYFPQEDKFVANYQHKIGYYNRTGKVDGREAISVMGYGFLDFLDYKIIYYKLKKRSDTIKKILDNGN